MKAVVLTGAGGVEMLELRDLPDPVIAHPEDVLVRLQAAGLNAVDYKLRRSGGYYLNRTSLILGCDGAGVVQAVGDDVTRFKAGDEGIYLHFNFNRV